VRYERGDVRALSEEFAQVRNVVRARQLPIRSSTEMCSGSEEGSYLRLIDFVYHSSLGNSRLKKRVG